MFVLYCTEIWFDFASSCELWVCLLKSMWPLQCQAWTKKSSENSHTTICDALPRKVHKVAGSERRYTRKQVVWPNFVDFELINFSVTLTTHSPPLNFWALIFIKKWLKSVIFRLVVDLNAAYFTRKYAVFNRCGGWSHCDKGHVWRINGNFVFLRILSLPLNERSLSLSRVNRFQIW